MMNTTLNNIVDSLIIEHIGGGKFFDALDKKIRKEEYVAELLFMATKEHHTSESKIRIDMGIVCSGRFGMYVVNCFNREEMDISTIVVNGGLRANNTKVFDMTPYAEHIKGKEFYFLDDSIYSGTTRDKVYEAIRSMGGTINNTYVVYDGMVEQDKTVHSLYRYHREA